MFLCPLKLRNSSSHRWSGVHKDKASAYPALAQTQKWSHCSENRSSSGLEGSSPETQPQRQALLGYGHRPRAPGPTWHICVSKPSSTQGQSLRLRVPATCNPGSEVERQVLRPSQDLLISTCILTGSPWDPHAHQSSGAQSSLMNEHSDDGLNLSYLNNQIRFLLVQSELKLHF